MSPPNESEIVYYTEGKRFFLGVGMPEPIKLKNWFDHEDQNVNSNSKDLEIEIKKIRALKSSSYSDEQKFLMLDTLVKLIGARPHEDAAPLLNSFLPSDKNMEYTDLFEEFYKHLDKQDEVILEKNIIAAEEKDPDDEWVTVPKVEDQARIENFQAVIPIVLKAHGSPRNFPWTNKNIADQEKKIIAALTAGVNDHEKYSEVMTLLADLPENSSLKKIFANNGIVSPKVDHPVEKDDVAMTSK